MQPSLQRLSHVRFRGTARVHAVANGVSAAASEVPALPGTLASYVLSSAGLDPADYRVLPLARRIPACLRAIGARSEVEAVASLERRPELRIAALATLLIGVSEFFRDPPVFEALRRQVVPGLLRPRVASIGCSGGAELYSVAILLAEAGVLDEAELLGVDCRANAIAAARAGEFSAHQMTHTGPALIGRYFDRTEGGYRAVPALRRRTSWLVADVAKAPPAGRFDLVLCRNLTIYLQTETAERLVRRLASALEPGGVLVVGKAERPAASLGLVQLERCVYRRPRE